MSGLGFRLNAVGQLSMVNDCSHPKLSLNGVFLAGPLYTSKLSLQAYSSRVTAFARVEVALPTHCSHPATVCDIHCTGLEKDQPKTRGVPEIVVDVWGSKKAA